MNEGQAYQVYHDAGVARVVDAMRQAGASYQVYNGEHRFWPQWSGACHQSSGKNAPPLAVYEGGGKVAGLVVAYCHSCNAASMGSVHALLGWRGARRNREELAYATRRSGNSSRCVGCGELAAPGSDRCVMCQLGWTRPVSALESVGPPSPECRSHHDDCVSRHPFRLQETALTCGCLVCQFCPEYAGMGRGVPLHG